MVRASFARSLLAWLTAVPLCAGESMAQDPQPGPAPAASTGADMMARKRAIEAFQGSQPEHAEWVAAHGKAIEWLRTHSAADGKLSAAGAGASDPADDVAATAAALLAFASSGASLKVGTYREAVRTATKWLVDQHRDDGWFCNPSHESSGLVQALATVALVHACVDAGYPPFAAFTERPLELFADAKAAPLGEPLALAIAAIAATADRRFRPGDGEAPVASLGAARLVKLLGANGACSADAGSFPFVGALPGTQEMAALAIAMACRGTTAMPDADARWKALAARLCEMPKRFGKNGELLDAVTLWCASDVAFQLGGEARDAFERVLSARVVPRFAGAAPAASITFACGPKVLRNEAAETALAALALAAPWFRVGR